MTDDPRVSLVDRQFRLRVLSNLRICDGSIFPESAGVAVFDSATNTVTVANDPVLGHPRSWFILKPMPTTRSSAYNKRWPFSPADKDSGDEYVEAHVPGKVDERENFYLKPVQLETTVSAETPRFGSSTEVPSLVDVLIRNLHEPFEARVGLTRRC